MLQIGRSLVRSQQVSLEFSIDIKSFRSHYGPGVDSASNRNEYQEHFLGGKGGRCVGLTTLPPSCAVVVKSGNLNFLEPSGPLQACNGTDLPLPFRWYKDRFTLRSLYSQVESPVRLYKRFGAFQSWCGGNCKEKKSLLPLGIEFQSPSPKPSRSIS